MIFNNIQNYLVKSKNKKRLKIKIKQNLLAVTYKFVISILKSVHVRILQHLRYKWINFCFQGKKDVAQVFNNILRRQIGTRSPTVEYICTKPEILFTLMRGYEHQDIALNCGTMLRECARYEALAKIMLYSDDFYNFFNYVEVSTFDIASDAFSTFKVNNSS
jgi:Mo25-like